MLHIAENLKSLRKSKDWTQEETAELLSVTPQSVSKWERGDTLPDIALLPTLANLYQTSVDMILGMDKINAASARTALFTAEQQQLHTGNYDAAIEVLENALKTFPNNCGFMSELAIALSLSGGGENLTRAATLCESVLAAEKVGEKVKHTTRAALCFVYQKLGAGDKATAVAQSLPHIRECREKVLEQLGQTPSNAEIDEYLRYIALGDAAN